MKKRSKKEMESITNTITVIPNLFSFFPSEKMVIIDFHY